MVLSIEQAATSLRQGCVVAYPTEAVYGFGCDPMNEQAVAAIWRLKRRPAGMGLIVVASQWAQLLPLMAPLTDAQHAQLAATWPGAMTWVVPASDQVPMWLTGGRDRVAVRLTAHVATAALCDAFGGALVSTSANIHGQPPLRTMEPLMTEFKDVAFAGVMEGALGERVTPTPIRDLVTGAWIRS